MRGHYTLVVIGTYGLCFSVISKIYFVTHVIVYTKNKVPLHLVMRHLQNVLYEEYCISLLLVCTLQIAEYDQFSMIFQI